MSDVVGSPSKYPTMIHLCIGSILSSVGIMFLNKQLMTEIHSPSYLSMVTFCTMWHQITAATFTKLFTVLGLKSTPPEEETVRPRVVIALAIGGSILFNNWALALLPVGTCQLFKLLCIPCIAIIQFIFHGQRVPLNVCGSLALLLIGVGIATVEQLSLEFLPASVALCGVLLTAISQLLVQRYNKENVPLQSMHLLQVTSPYIASLMALCFLVMENVYPSGILKVSTWNSGQALPILVLSSMVAITTNFYGYSLIQNCSAVTFQVIGNLKTVIVLVISFVCADLMPSEKRLFGIVIALIGSGVYGRVKINSKNAEALPIDSVQIRNSRPLTESLSAQQRCRAFFTTARPRQVFVFTITIGAFLLLLLLNCLPRDASSKYDSDNANRDELLKDSLDALRDAIIRKSPSDVFALAEKVNAIPPKNCGLFIPAKNSIPLMVLVHNRESYLTVLIEQLRNNPRINETLLILVHDGIFQPVLDAINKIDFCQVKQLFTPFSWSIQSELGDQFALRNSSNSLKFNWLWAFQQAFEVVQPNATHIAYIEDDFWVLPDYYLTLLEIREYIAKNLADEFPYGFNVGTRPSSFAEQKAYDFNITVSANHMTGWVGTRMFWKQFKMSTELYCRNPSQNWDYTLGAMWMYGVTSRWTLQTSPRLVHAGFCGGFHHTTDPSHPFCNITRHANEFDAWRVDFKTRNWTFDKTTITQNLAEASQRAVTNSASRDEGLWLNETMEKACLSLVRPFNSY